MIRISDLQNLLEIDRGPNRTLGFFEGMRGFAMLWIFAIHYVVNYIFWAPQASIAALFSSGVFTFGQSGVDLFFLISGYFTYAAFVDHPRPFGKFLIRRAKRIYPPFLVVFVIYIALSFAAPEVSKIPSQPVDAALYLLANLLLLPGIFNILPMISVAWALSYEALSYLTLPPLTMLIRSWPRAARIAAALAISALLIAGYLVNPLVPARMSAFLAGVVVFELSRSSGRLRIPNGSGLLAIPLLCLLIWPQPITPAGMAARFAANFFCLSVLVLDPLKNSSGITSRAFSWTPLRWFGNMSYSYFLIHGLVLRVGSYLLRAVYPPAANNEALFWVGLVILFPATVAAGLALYLLVERPTSFARRTAALPANQSMPSKEQL